jgi:hypothetical protein
VAANDRSVAADQVLVGCLAQKGYVIVPEAEADAKSAQFRAIAETAKRQGIATSSAEPSKETRLSARPLQHQGLSSRTSSYYSD